MIKPVQAPCPVCMNGSEYTMISSKVEGDEHRTILGNECPRCGLFNTEKQFDHIAIEENGYLGKRASRKRANLSAWLRDNTDDKKRNEYAVTPIELDSSFLDPNSSNELRMEFEAVGTPRFHEKADKLLLAIEKKTLYAGHNIEFDHHGDNVLKWYARAWALNRNEFYEVVQYLQRVGRLEGPRSAGTSNFVITPDGWAYIEELVSAPVASKQGFVAMWFDDEVKDLYDKALAPAIRAAGYAPLRIDKKATSERIDDRIEVEIKRSRFVIADATGHRGGVYYEAGFARGFKIPVIWTCRKDHFDDRHFDTSQFHCESWTEDTFDELADQLRWRIENICGRGPLKYEDAH